MNTEPHSRLQHVRRHLTETLTRIKEVGAPQLVESIVLRIFLSLFPLIVIATAVLGFVAASRKGGSTKLAEDLIRQMKLSGSLSDMIRDIVTSAKDNRGATSVVGFVTVLISATSVVGAIASACDTPWQVPRRGLKDRLLGVAWLLGAGILIAASGVATALIKIIPIPGLNALVGFFSGAIVGALLFWWTQVTMTNIKIPLRAFLPGAAFAGVGLSLFQIFGTVLVGRLLASQKGGPASLAAVLAFLSFLMVFAWLFVLSVVVNVLTWEHTHGTDDLAIRVPSLPNRVCATTTRSGVRMPTVKPENAVAKFASQRIRQRKQEQTDEQVSSN